MATTIRCGECRVDFPTLRGVMEHYMAGCGTTEPCTLEEALEYATEGIRETSWAYADMLREWWGCKDSEERDVREFAAGIAFCFWVLGFDVDSPEGLDNNEH